MPEIKAVIVDVDDTLCMTEAACFDLENETLRRLDRSPMSREIHLATWGQPLYDAIQLRSPGVDPDKFWELMPRVHTEFIESGKIDIIPEENLAVLDQVVAMAKLVIILTSRTELESRHLMGPAHHLGSRITAFYHKDNTDYHKPDPRVFDVIEANHQFKPNECVYVGDSPSDALAANGAGLHFIGSLESGIRTPEDFAGSKVDLFIPRFILLPDAIRTLESA